MLLGSHWVQFTEALWPGRVVTICAVCQKKKKKTTQKTKERKKSVWWYIRRWVFIEWKLEGRERNLGGEYSNGVLGTKGYQITSSPWNIVHNSVAPCSYKHFLHLHSSIYWHGHQNKYITTERKNQEENREVVTLYQIQRAAKPNWCSFRLQPTANKERVKVCAGGPVGPANGAPLHQSNILHIFSYLKIKF